MNKLIHITRSVAWRFINSLLAIRVKGAVTYSKVDTAKHTNTACSEYIFQTRSDVNVNPLIPLIPLIPSDDSITKIHILIFAAIILCTD